MVSMCFPLICCGGLSVQASPIDLWRLILTLLSDVSVYALGMYSGTFQTASTPLLMEIFKFLDHSFCLQETIWMSP